MKTSRITLAALLLLVLAAMTSCEQGKEKGVAMGAEFAKAWTGDDQALDQQVLKVTAALDSLTFKSAFADAFIAEAGKSDSTVALAARVLVKDGATVTGLFIGNRPGQWQHHLHSGQCPRDAAL